MEFLTLGGLVKAVAVAFGAATLATPPPQPSGRTAGGTGGRPLPRETLPFARSRDAVELVVAPPRGRPRIAVDDTPPPLALPPRKAARLFVAWMQAQGWHGERAWAGKNGVWDYYMLHCACEDLAPCPDNLFGAALARIAKKRVVRAGLDGLPERPTFYAIPAPAPAKAPRKPAEVRQSGGSRRRAA